MYNVAKLWCRSYRLDNVLCQHCNNRAPDNIVHLLSECVATAMLRTRFMCNVTYFGIEFASDLLDLDQTMFALKIMGAPLSPVLENDVNEEFLSWSYQFITDCLSYL